MSFRPRPAESVHAKRPSGVSAAPVGRLPSLVNLPTGSSLRPLGCTRVSGPIRPGGAPAANTIAAAAAAVARIASATQRSRRLGTS